MKTIEEKIKAYTKEIRLPGIRKNYKTLVEEFQGRNNNYNLFLYKLLEIEYATRVKSRKESRIRQAAFPYKKYLEELKYNELPKEAQNRLSELTSL